MWPQPEPLKRRCTREEGSPCDIHSVYRTSEQIANAPDKVRQLRISRDRERLTKSGPRASVRPRKCYKTRKPPISERPLSGLVFRERSRKKLQNGRNVTSGEGRRFLGRLAGLAACCEAMTEQSVWRKMCGWASSGGTPASPNFRSRRSSIIPIIRVEVRIGRASRGHCRTARICPVVPEADQFLRDLEAFTESPSKPVPKGAQQSAI